MTVKQILNQKGRDVFTMHPSVTLEEAAQALARRRIGALVLLGDGGELAGILSERDIVRMIGTKGAACLSEPVAGAMTEKVVTCGEETSVNEVMEIMTRGRFRHVPVALRNKIIGIVSIGDVVKQRIEDAERDAADMRSYISAG